MLWDQIVFVWDSITDQLGERIDGLQFLQLLDLTCAHGCP